MTEVGYEPDRRARALASQRSLLIGLAYNNRNPSYVLDLLAGSQAAANAKGYEVVMHEIADGQAAAEEIIKFMRRSACDGLIITPPLSESATLIAQLTKQSWPLVRIAGDHTDFDAPQIRYNDRTAALSIATELVKKGHKRIAFMGGPEEAGPTRRRLSGVKDALALYDLTLSDTQVRFGDFTFNSGQMLGSDLLKNNDRPSAIICANDEMAAGVYRSAAELGIAIPLDLSVTGFDDSPTASHLYPPLTSVRQPLQDMMASAVTVLTNAAEANGKVISQFEAVVVPRESVAPPRHIVVDS